MPSDRFREIEVFVSVVETGSFSAAARKLDCTPSAVSKLIDRLEGRLGVRLLQRSTRQLAMTQEGRAFHQSAEHVLQALESAEIAMVEAGSPTKGVVRVHTTLAFAEQQLAPDLPALLARHPLLRMEFVLTSGPIDMVAEDIDVSIQVGPVASQSQVVKQIGTAQRIVCAAPAYLRRFGIPETPDDLAQHNCVNFLHDSPRSKWTLRTADQDRRIQVGGQVASNSDNFLRVLACQGAGIAYLADFHVARDIQEGRLVRILSRFDLAEREPIYAVLPTNRRLSPRVNAVLRFLENRLSKSLR